MNINVPPQCTYTTANVSKIVDVFLRHTGKIHLQNLRRFWITLQIDKCTAECIAVTRTKWRGSWKLYSSAKDSLPAASGAPRRMLRFRIPFGRGNKKITGVNQTIKRRNYARFRVNVLYLWTELSGLR